MLTRAEIKGFKCLHDVSVDLGRFNVLIGPNDSGKSSFLQALAWASRLKQGKPHVPSGTRAARVCLRTETSEMVLEVPNSRWSVSLGGAEVDASYLHSIPVDRLPAAIQACFRVSDPVMVEPAEIASTSPKGTGTLSELIRTRGRGATAHLARVALGDRERYEAIQKGMRDISGGRVRELIVGEDQGAGYSLSFRLCDDSVIPASEVSQGLLVYFAFLAIVHRDDAPEVLLVEEPENGVHPLRLHEIVTLLRTLTERGVQIVLTTHSPDLLSACKPEEVLVFRRPDPESGTEIRRLPADFERRAMRSTLGEIWASGGEEGLLDMLPAVEPRIKAEPA
jgi:energy-coupling factor transporter ATP-binding protein EcfA2